MVVPIGDNSKVVVVFNKLHVPSFVSIPLTVPFSSPNFRQKIPSPHQLSYLIHFIQSRDIIINFIIGSSENNKNGTKKEKKEAENPP